MRLVNASLLFIIYLYCVFFIYKYNDSNRICLAMFNQKAWQGRTLEVREDRGFVDPNIQNNVNGNGHHHHHYQHHQHHSQDHSRHPTTNHSHPYGGPMIGLGGLFYGVSNTFKKSIY